MTGKMSITADTDNNDVLKYQYTLNCNPKMWILVDFKKTNVNCLWKTGHLTFYD